MTASEFVAFSGLRDKPLGWDDLLPLVRKGAAIQKKAWEFRGKKPTVADMEKGFRGETKLYGKIIVNGGAPPWMVDEIPDWGKRIYKPGPFKLK